MYYLEGDHPPDPLPFILQRLLSSNCFKDFYWLINLHSVIFWGQRRDLRILLSRSRISPIWVDKVVVFMQKILHKWIIGNDPLRLYGIHITHKNPLVKLCNIIVFINTPNKKYRIRNILKDASDIAKVIGLKESGTLKARIIYQYYSTSILNTLPG